MTQVSFGALVARSCPLCGADGVKRLLADQYYTLAPGDVMHIVECRRCTLMFTDPIPSPEWQRTFLDPAINTGWDAGVWMKRHWQEENEQQKFLDGLEILERMKAGPRLLDVGTGPGLFVRLARQGGYDAHGFDILPQVEDQVQIPIVTGALTDLPPEAYDVVTLWCVVAHEPDFTGLLRDCARLLRLGGLILVETPNMTLWRRLRGARALLERTAMRQLCHDALGAYGHINHFTVRTLTRTLEVSGFDPPKSHLVSNYRAQRTLVDAAKRLAFTASGTRINLSFPLVMTAAKR